MTSTIFFFAFIPLLALILLAVNLIFAPHSPYMEKEAVFECGFSSFLGQNRAQFSISFFIFALLFLLFDLEILLVYPYLVSAYTNDVYGLAIMLMFLLALTLGFAFELGKKALSIDSRQDSSGSEEPTKASTSLSSICTEEASRAFTYPSPPQPASSVKLSIQSGMLSALLACFFRARLLNNKLMNWPLRSRGSQQTQSSVTNRASSYIQSGLLRCGASPSFAFAAQEAWVPSHIRAYAILRKQVRAYATLRKQATKTKPDAINKIGYIDIANSKGPIYVNADIQKAEILNDNHGKSGVYKWTRRRGGRSYIGSSIDIKGRLRNYFNYSYLETQAKHDNSLICKALLQYGYYAFSFEILSYCQPTDLKRTEQEYMDLLNPKYNILKAAGNPGLKRTEISKERMRSAKLGTSHSEETKAKMSASRDNSKAVRVTNDKTGEVTECSSMRRAADMIGINCTTVSKSINKQGQYKGRGYTVYTLLH